MRGINPRVILGIKMRRAVLFYEGALELGFSRDYACRELRKIRNLFLKCYPGEEKRFNQGLKDLEKKRASSF